MKRKDWFGPVAFKDIIQKGVDGAFGEKYKDAVNLFEKSRRKKLKKWEYPVIYRIEICRPLHRAPCNILQVGQAGNLFYRIGIFIGAALGFRTKHSEGEKFYETRKSLRLGIQDLQLYWKRFGGPPKTDKKKKRLAQEEARATNRVINEMKPGVQKWVIKFRKNNEMTHQNISLPILMSQDPRNAKKARGWD